MRGLKEEEVTRIRIERGSRRIKRRMKARKDVERNEGRGGN